MFAVRQRRKSNDAPIKLALDEKRALDKCLAEFGQRRVFARTVELPICHRSNGSVDSTVVPFYPEK